MAAAYSGTPLATKLGIKSGSTLLVVNDPGRFYDQSLRWSLSQLRSGSPVTSPVNNR